MSKHGMQMGGSGYGMTHGYVDGDDVDHNNSHEYGSGHGVSEKWIQSRTKAGLAKAGDARAAKFARNTNKMAHPGAQGASLTAAKHVQKKTGMNAYRNEKWHSMGEVDTDNSHEYAGHGVSASWVEKRVSGAKASGARKAKFGKKMDDMKSRLDKKGVGPRGSHSDKMWGKVSAAQHASTPSPSKGAAKKKGAKILGW